MSRDSVHLSDSIQMSRYSKTPITIIQYLTFWRKSLAWLPKNLEVDPVPVHVFRFLLNNYLILANACYYITRLRGFCGNSFSNLGWWQKVGSRFSAELSRTFVLVFSTLSERVVEWFYLSWSFVYNNQSSYLGIFILMLD